MNMAKSQKYQNRGLLEGVGKLYLNSKTADVHFKFGSDDDESSIIRVPAHKKLLAIVSNVFDAMFYGDLKENDDIQVIDRRFIRWCLQRVPAIFLLE